MKTAENNESELADLEAQEEFQNGQPEHSVEKSRAAELLSVILNSRFLKFLAVIGIPFLVNACAGAGKNINETKVALLQTLDREFTGLQADGSSTACADGIGDKDSAEQAAKLRAFLALKGAKANAAVIELFRKNGINAFVEGSIENVTYSEASQQMGDEDWTACALAQLGTASAVPVPALEALPARPTGVLSQEVTENLRRSRAAEEESKRNRSRTGDAGEMASPDATPKDPKKTTKQIKISKKANKAKNVIQPNVSGPLTDDMMIKTIYDRRSAISNCWASANKGGGDPDLVNASMKKIVIKMIVKPNGTVASAKIISNSFKSHGKKLGQCMVRRIKGWRFPKSTEGGSLTCPFTF